jgi:O-antigen ligase
MEPSYGDEAAKQARLVAWMAGMRMVQAHPVAGVGLGNFKPLVESYEDPEWHMISVAHNTYIETAAELGLPALLVHCVLLGAAFIAFGRTRRRAKKLNRAHLYQLALGLQAGLLSYIVSACFVSSWWQKPVWLIVFLAVCIERVSHRSRRPREHIRAGTDPTERRQPCGAVTSA